MKQLLTFFIFIVFSQMMNGCIAVDGRAPWFTEDTERGYYVGATRRSRYKGELSVESVYEGMPIKYVRNPKCKSLAAGNMTGLTDCEEHQLLDLRDAYRQFVSQEESFLTSQKSTLGE